MMKGTFSPCARVWMRSDAQMMAEKKAKKEEREPVFTAAQQRLLDELGLPRTYVGSLEVCVPAPRVQASV